MTRNGVDFSWARPGGAAIRAAGNEFVMRYVPYRGDGGKGLEPEEVDDYHANGLSIGLVFESTAMRHLDGFGAGQLDALIVQEALARMRVPETVGIHFGADFDVQPGQFAAIDTYQYGAASVLGMGRVGIYGHADLIDHCHDIGSATWFWQTYAWSRGRRSQWAHVYQYLNGQTLNGGEVDLCEAFGSEQGLWRPGQQEDAMTDNDILAVFGSTERDPAARLAAAKYRYQQALESGHSPFDVAAQAIYSALHASGAVTDTMSPDEVRAIVDAELAKARIVVGGN